MSTRPKIAAVSLALLVVLALLWRAVPESAQEPVGGGKESAAAVESLAPEEPPAPGPSAPAIEPTTPPSEPATVERVAAGADEIRVAGRVTDRVTGAPVTDFELWLARRVPGRRPTPLVHASVHDDDGRFSFQLEQGGRHAFTVRSARHRVYNPGDLDVPAAPGLRELAVELDPGNAVRGRVVDHDTGRPVAGALVTSDAVAGAGLAHRLFGFEQHDVCSYTGADGRFVLTGLERRQQRIAALHPDYAEGYVELTPERTAAEVAEGTRGADEVELRLQRGAHVFGTARDDAGRPAAGLTIAASGLSTPVARVALTAADGSFRTPPLLPGLLNVRATPPPGETAEGTGFTPETKTVELAGADVELHFGPTDEHVTWRGVVRGADGTALPDAELELRAEGGPRYPAAGGFHLGAADEHGRFELHKLLVGSYAVTVQLRAERGRVDWGSLELERPGLVERDLQLAGIEVRGTIVHGGTGRPLTHEDGAFVMAMVQGTTWHSFSAFADERGRFRLRGMGPGRYRLSVQATGMPIEGRDLELVEGQPAEELRLVLQPGGWLDLRLEGFADLGLDAYTLSLKSADSSGSGLNSNGWLAEDGTAEREFGLRAGEYALRLEFADWGAIDRPLTIAAGQRTALVLHPEDRAEDPEVITVAGHIAGTDGTPLSGARILLFPLEVPGVAMGSFHATALADTEGRFTLSGLKPGRWFVNATLADGYEHQFPALVLPPDAESPFLWALVFHAGEVAALLVDGHTGRTFADERPDWWAWLVDAQTGEDVSGGSAGRRGAELSLRCVPEGRYRLTVRARGFADHVVDPVVVAAGERVDLGELHLPPAGVLDLEVVDPEGQAVASTTILCDGEVLSRSQLEHRVPGAVRCHGLPLGAATITVRAAGFQEETATVELAPGEIARLRVELRR